MSLKKIFAVAAVPVLTLCLWIQHPSSIEAKAVEGVVNINTATPVELNLLPGVGKAKAEQIVQYRQGKAFTSVDDLKNIPGLGAKRIEAMRPHVVVEGPTTAKRISTKKEEAPAATPSNPPS